MPVMVDIADIGDMVDRGEGDMMVQRGGSRLMMADFLVHSLGGVVVHSC